MPPSGACAQPPESIAFRWFCFLTIYDAVFDHSTISCFFECFGRDGFGEKFHGLNQGLLRLGLLSPELYAESTLVKAKVSSHCLSRSWLTVAEFQDRAEEEIGLFALGQAGADEGGAEEREVELFQDPKAPCR